MSPTSAVITMDYKVQDAAITVSPQVQVCDLQRRLNKLRSRREDKTSYRTLLVTEIEAEQYRIAG